MKGTSPGGVESLANDIDEIPTNATQKLNLDNKVELLYLLRFRAASTGS
jgi:hypothetical protein